MSEITRQTVLIVGDAMMDSYKTCDMNRISPEAPVPVLKVRSQFRRLGGAANLASGIAAMGVECSLCALVGKDDMGAQMQSMLSEANVGDASLLLENRPTIVKERILAMNQQICRVDYEEPFTADDSRQLMEHACRIIDDYSLVAVSDYDKGCSLELRILMNAAKKRGIPVLVDPKRADWSLYGGAFLVKPNWKEFLATADHERLLTGPLEADDHAQVADIGQALLMRFDLTHLLVTAGSKGWLHISKEGVTTGSTLAREVFDLSGAGDSFLATLIAFLAKGTKLDQAIRMGNMAAGIAVGRLGTTVVHLDELELECRPSSRGAKAESLAEIHRLAARGKRIVFTNGCFDILHSGHLSLLETARAMGDILVVGINSDDSVKRLKGESRPVNDLKDRKTLLEGLRPVDFVIAFDEDTPLSLIETVRPDILVKGGDYTRDTIVGADFIEERGGQVAIVKILEGRSTSNIIAKARRGC